MLSDLCHQLLDFLTPHLDPFVRLGEEKRTGLKIVPELYFKLESLALITQACASALAHDKLASIGDENENHKTAANALGAMIPYLARLLVEQQKQQLPFSLETLGKYEFIGRQGNTESVLARRHSGFTQTEVVEWKWVTEALKVIKPVLTEEGGLKVEDEESVKVLNEVLESRLRAIPT